MADAAEELAELAGPAAPTAMVSTVLRWFTATARPLPWRAPDRTAWGVLVSEFMLQQTPVDRVLPIWHEWLRRWPTPKDLACAAESDVLRAWGRLGYPRRARWLHLSARQIVAQHDGEVPNTQEALRALPGVGEYTAAAVCAFAYGQPTVVLDTNIRRVLVRAHEGRDLPTAHITRHERAMAARLVAAAGVEGAAWSAAVMELGALTCRSRRPDCSSCPLQDHCRWHADGQPPGAQPMRRAATYTGSDRQARGEILACLRAHDGPIPMAMIAQAWSDQAQRERALDTLISDGLAHAGPDGIRLGSALNRP